MKPIWKMSKLPSTSFNMAGLCGRANQPNKRKSSESIPTHSICSEKPLPIPTPTKKTINPGSQNRPNINLQSKATQSKPYLICLWESARDHQKKKEPGDHQESARPIKIRFKSIFNWSVILRDSFYLWYPLRRQKSNPTSPLWNKSLLTADFLPWLLWYGLIRNNSIIKFSDFQSLFKAWFKAIKMYVKLYLYNEETIVAVQWKILITTAHRNLTHLWDLPRLRHLRQ